jgi:hypothetical protein
MVRLAPAALACVAFAAPLLVARERPVALLGLLGLLLAAVGLIACWRWPITGAAGVFLLEYVLALLVAQASTSFVFSAGFGVTLFLLLQSADLALRTRHAAADLTVLLGQVGRWFGLGGGVLVAGVLGVGLAMALAPSLPVAASPFLAGAGALGIVVSVAAMVVHAARRRSRGPS